MPLSPNSRVLIPNKFWTPVRNEIFANILGRLKQKRSAHVYLTLYDRAWHSDSKQVSATVAELAGWMGMDPRTLSKCLRELEKKDLIDRVDNGVPRSQINKPCWQVPLVQFRLQNEKWTPVPRFLITDYLPAFPNAVLLAMLIFYQHMSWNNFCWVGVKTLSERTGWSAARVRRPLRTMQSPSSWERATRKNLPCPLKITVVNERRRYRVLAVKYITIPTTRRGKKSQKVVIVSREFRKRFDLPQPYYYG